MIAFMEGINEIFQFMVSESRACRRTPRMRIEGRPAQPEPAGHDRCRNRSEPCAAASGSPTPGRVLLAQRHSGKRDRWAHVRKQRSSGMPITLPERS